VLLKLIEDEQPEVRTQAVKASSGRHALIQLQSRLLLNDLSWAVRQAAATALGSHPKLQGGADLLRALAQDSDSDVGSECAKQLDRQLMSDGSAAAEQLPTDIELLCKAEAAVVQLGGRFNYLLNWLRGHTAIEINPLELAKYGTDLTALAEAKTLPRAHHVESMLATLIDLLGRQRRRSITLIGRAGAGKTALVNEPV